MKEFRVFSQHLKIYTAKEFGSGEPLGVGQDIFSGILLEFISLQTETGMFGLRTDGPNIHDFQKIQPPNFRFMLLVQIILIMKILIDIKTQKTRNINIKEMELQKGALELYSSLGVNRTSLKNTI